MALAMDVVADADANANDDEVRFDGYLTMSHRKQDWVVTTASSVYCCSMSTTIDLSQFSQAARVKYNPTHVPAVNYPLLYPKCMMMLYESGKVICLGGEFKVAAELAFQKMAVVLRTFGFNRAFVVNVRLDNTTCVLKPIRTPETKPIHINLRQFSEHPKYRSHVQCQRSFNSALLTIDTRTFDGQGNSHRGVSANVFASGNCNILGTRNPEHMVAAAGAAIRILTHVSREQQQEM